MGLSCSNHGCCSNEEERSTYYFSNSFPFKDRFFKKNEDIEKPKNYLLIDNSMNRPSEIKNTEFEKESVSPNVSNLDFSFMDNGGERSDFTEKNLQAILSKINEKESKLNTKNIEKEVVIDLAEKEEKIAEKVVKNVMDEVDLTKLSKIQYKFLFHLHRKKFEKMKIELEENSQKFYNNKVSKFENKDLNYPKFDSSNFESIFHDNPLIKEKGKLFLLNTKILSKNNTFYSGQTSIANKKYGLGKLRLADKRSYEGYWIDDIFICGRYIDISGNLFEGNFLDGQLNGYGVKFTKDDTIYRGNFLNGLKSGQGIETTKVYLYIGSFENDMKHGKGKINFNLQEETYEGDFFEGKITGKGTFKWKNKDSYIGDVVDKKMQGRGIYLWEDGSEYEGEYVDNIKEGFGKFKWNNGNTFEGSFSKGVPHGKGTLTAKGYKFKCEFTEGKLSYKGDMIE